MREIRTLHVMWRELETERRKSPPATAPVSDPTAIPLQGMPDHFSGLIPTSGFGNGK